MTDQPPAAKPTKTPRAPRVPLTVPQRLERSAVRVLRDLGPYALAMGIFAITAHWKLNPTAARYGDELFAIALVLIKTGAHIPPSSKP